MKQSPTASIYRFGQTREVQPASKSVLESLRTIAHVAVPQPAGPFGASVAPVPLYNEAETSAGSGLVCWAGLEPVVRTLLTREGYKVELIGRPFASLPPPDHDRLNACDVLDRPLLDGVRHQERALIRYAANQADPVHLIAQIALAWPEQKIAVVATRIAEGRQIRDRLCAYGIDAVAVNSENQPPEVGSVVVCTPVGLSHLPVKVEWLDIVLALDARDIVGKIGMECIGHAWRARLFGLLENGARPAPLERDFMTALFGFDEIVIPRHGYRKRVVQVLCCPIRGGMVLPAKQDVLAAKRRGLWHHTVRNRQIAKIVRSFREGRHDVLRKMLSETDALRNYLLAQGIVVLVENLEHALALSRRLPDWPVLTGLDAWKEGLSAEQAKRSRPISPFGEMSPLYAIVTSTAIGVLDLTHVGVLVRADGGVGLPALPTQALVESAVDVPRPLFLIDFHDRHHPLLRRWRQEAYAERGWLAPGVDAVQARVERFLATRPKEVRQ